MKHELVDNTLCFEREKSGTAKGIIGRCTCGWSTGYRFSSFAASAALREHQENCAHTPDREGR